MCIVLLHLYIWTCVTQTLLQAIYGVYLEKNCIQTAWTQVQKWLNCKYFTQLQLYTAKSQYWLQNIKQVHKRHYDVTSTWRRVGMGGVRRVFWRTRDHGRFAVFVRRNLRGTHRLFRWQRRCHCSDWFAGPRSMFPLRYFFVYPFISFKLWLRHK